MRECLVRYDEPLFRPPSEADSFILQATLGCSWNACTYCAMYRGKRYQERPLTDVLAEVREAGDALEVLGGGPPRSGRLDCGESGFCLRAASALDVMLASAGLCCWLAAFPGAKAL